MATQTQTHTSLSNSLLARRGVQANGLFDLVAGAILVTSAGPLARTFGLEEPLWLGLLGATLFGTAALQVWMAAQSQVRRSWLLALAVLSIVWAIGSVIVLAAGWLPLTTAGKWAVALQADAVALFGLWHLYSARRQRE